MSEHEEYNFPEAVRLLRLALIHVDNDSNYELAEKIREFLKQSE